MIISSSLATTNPAIISLCPPRNFVALCNVISIPKSSGLCKYGVINVLSIIEIRLFSFAIVAIPLISVTANNGFDGVSINIAFVFSFIALLTALRSVASTNVNSIPKF